jgi:hypothetical protein
MQLLVSLLYVKALQEPDKGTQIHFSNLLIRLGPTKHILFQTFHPDAEAILLPIKDLDKITLSIAKRKKAAGEQIKVKLFFNKQGKAVDGFAHVRGAKGEKNPDILRWPLDHNCSRLDTSWVSAVCEKFSLISMANLFWQTRSNSPVDSDITALEGNVNG